jgi:hypothetical protein
MKNSVHNWVHTLKDTRDLGRQMSHSDCAQRERTTGETETTQENIENWLEQDERDPGFQLLTEEQFAANVIKDSAMEKESDNELDELQKSTSKKKILSSARDGVDAVINYVDSSTNRRSIMNT